MTHRTDEEQQPGPAFRPLESITILAVIGMLGLALGLVALSRPATRVESQNLTYTQSGTFSYSATAPSKSVYGAKGLKTGQPILTKTVGPVHVRFAYRLSAHAPANVHGTAGMDVKVDLGQGFSKTFPVAAPRSFTGERASVSGVLPVKAITSYVKAANNALGNLGGATETVTLQPKIKLSGAVGGHALKQTTYAPTLPFTLSGTTLTVSNGSAPTDPGTPAADPLKPSKDGSVSYQTSAPNTVSLLVVHPSVTASRIAGFGIAVLCLLLCLWFARPLRAGRSIGDRDRIRALYGAQLVPVSGIDAHYGPIVEVAGIEALAELAKKYESMILQLAESEADSYLVWDNGIMFRYRVAHPAAETAEPPASEDAEADAVGGVEQLLRSDLGDLDAANGALVGSGSARHNGARGRDRSRARQAK